MSIYYSYSKLNNGNVYSTYLKIYDVFKDKIINKESLDLETLQLSQLFICDITPDYNDNNISFVDSNIMIQLGIALKKFNNKNILLLLDESITKNVPIILKNYNIHYYNSTLDNYHLNIIEKIKINNINYYLPINDDIFDIEF